MADLVGGRPEMVLIPPGHFLMGNSASFERRNELPAHEVRIDYSFELGKYPVTVGEFEAFESDTKHERRFAQIWYRGTGWIHADGPATTRFPQTDRDPVCNINWYDAAAYVKWLNAKFKLTIGVDGFRLPSEAEWEYSCRAGSTTQFSFGDDIRELEEFAFIPLRDRATDRSPFPVLTDPVGRRRPNAFGLHDMHGNVWEWCEDLWHSDYDGAPTDGSAWMPGGDDSYGVIRGGIGPLSVPTVLKSSTRSRHERLSRMSNIGFRVARSVPA